LATKTEEFANYRRTKHTEFVKLQSEHDSLRERYSALESSYKALQSSYKSQSQQLSEALSRSQDLAGRLAEQEASYSAQAALEKRLIETMQERELQAKALVDKIENEWATVGDRAERREAVLREDIEAQRQRAEEAESRVAELQAILDRMDRGEFPIPGAHASASVPTTPIRGLATPSVNGTPDFLTQGMIGLSPTVAMASRAQRGGRTFTEVYADYVKLQDELVKKNAECDHMDRTLSQVLAQIEERVSVTYHYSLHLS
jgi:nucleoprotein TPR